MKQYTSPTLQIICMWQSDIVRTSNFSDVFINEDKDVTSDDIGVWE